MAKDDRPLKSLTGGAAPQNKSNVSEGARGAKPASGGARPPAPTRPSSTSAGKKE